MTPGRLPIPKFWVVSLTAAVAVAASLWAFAVLWPSLSGLDPTDPRVTLADVERAVARRYPVAELDSGGLAVALAGGDTVVFDVREPAEFEQSHIPGAVRIDPGMSAADFLDRHAGDIRGKRVVFYCAVGVRSGTMAERIQPRLAAVGSRGVYNLRGGIFRWRSDGGSIVAAGGPAQTVHPYNAAWGSLRDRTLANSSPTPPTLSGRP